MARQGLTHRTLSGMFWMGAGRLAGVVLQVIVLGVLARFLTPADFGVVSAALVVIGLSAIMSQIGLGPTLVQRRELEPRHVDTAFTASVVLGLVVAAAVWGVAPLASAGLGVAGTTPILRALAWSFPLQALGLVSESLLRRDLRFRWIANRDVVTYAVGYGAVGISLALAGAGAWSLVWAQLAQVALRTAILLVRHPPNLRSAGDARSFRELMYFSGGFTLAKLANYVALQVDNVVVGRMLGASALGFYGRAYQLMTAPAHGIGLVLDNVLFPAMARVQDDPARLRAAFRRGVALIALLVLPLSLTFLVVAPEAVRVLLGEQWLAAVAPFEVFALGMLFRTSYKMSDSLARSTGAVYRRALRQAQYAVLVLVGAVVGQRWGITGVAWGVLLAVVVNFLAMAQLSLDVAGMRWREFAGAHLAAMRLAAVTTPAAWLGAAVMRAYDAPAVMVLATACTGAALTAAALVVRYPTTFLGVDGVWMLAQLHAFVPRRVAFLIPVPSRIAGP